MSPKTEWNKAYRAARTTYQYGEQSDYRYLRFYEQARLTYRLTRYKSSMTQIQRLINSSYDIRYGSLKRKYRASILVMKTNRHRFIKPLPG